MTLTVRHFVPLLLMVAGLCHAMGLKPEEAAGPAASAAATVAKPASAESALDGADVYAGKCQFCHGPNMVTPGGGAYDLRKFPLDDRPRFETSVLKGKNAMPAWQGIITPAEIDAVWLYVQTRGK